MKNTNQYHSLCPGKGGAHPCPVRAGPYEALHRQYQETLAVLSKGGGTA
ncbi:hypothetical protein [Acutalibacter sp. JLR.KK004]